MVLLLNITHLYLKGAMKFSVISVSQAEREANPRQVVGHGIPEEKRLRYFMSVSFLQSVFPPAVLTMTM